MKKLLFAIDEVGSFAYLAPLFDKWAIKPPENIEWGIVVAPVLEKFQLFQNMQSSLPLLKLQQARSFGADKLVLSITKDPTFTLKLLNKSSENLAILDSWNKRWNTDLYQGLQNIAVIDSEHATQLREEGWSGNTAIVGQPAWENIQPLPPTNEHKILYIAQPIMKIYGNSLGFNENSTWTALSDFVESTAYKYTLSYAVHPLQDLQNLPQNIDFLYDIQAALKTHGTIISFSSSAMVDAWIGGRRVISFQPNTIAEDKCYLSAKGHISRVVNTKDLKNALHADQKSQRKISSFYKSLERLETEILRFSNI